MPAAVRGGWPRGSQACRPRCVQVLKGPATRLSLCCACLVPRWPCLSACRRGGPRISGSGVRAAQVLVAQRGESTILSRQKSSGAEGGRSFGPTGVLWPSLSERACDPRELRRSFQMGEAGRWPSHVHHTSCRHRGDNTGCPCSSSCICPTIDEAEAHRARYAEENTESEAKGFVCGHTADV